MFNIVEKMNSAILHRGPDGNGIYSNGLITMGMQRLAIIDLESGTQPIFNADKSIVIVFNGEIYNFKELRKGLELSGVVFQTNSDTEVILKGYEIMGIDFFKYLNGMFAFAIHDQNINKLYVVRDRVGEKPLYYYSKDKIFIFGSELKSIICAIKNLDLPLPEISTEALSLYFSLTYIPAPFSIFNNINKLSPGSIIEYCVKNFEFKILSYWDITKTASIQPEHNFSSAKSKLKELLYDSVEKRMIADVPLGAFLSGGVDSSIISAIMADIQSDTKINTFTIGYKNKLFDESDRAKMLASHINSNHYVHYLDYNDLQSSIDQVILNYDEPFADSSALPTYFVSKMTGKHVKVALTGDGGDEVFGGYNRYDMVRFGNTYRTYIPGFLHENVIKKVCNGLPLRSDNRGLLFKIKKFINGVSVNEREDIKNIISLGFLEIELKDLLKGVHSKNILSDILVKLESKASNFSSLGRSRYYDFKISLEGDMLTKVDRASMLASIECRTPLLDHKIIEFSYSLPDHFLINNGEKKFILKETFKHLLPKNYLDAPKKGFGVPVGDWLRQELKEDLLRVSNEKFIDNQNLFEPQYINNLVNRHVNGIEDNTFRLWTFYCFQKWWCNIYEEKG